MSNAYAQNNNNGNDVGKTDNIAKTSYFSIEPLDNWTYEINSDKTTAQTMGSGASNAIILYPNDIDIITGVESGNALIANFEQDNTYNVKNAPLSNYVKYKTENAIAPITSQQNIIIDGESAVKVLSNGKGDYGNIKYLFIYTIHDKKYYAIGLMGNTNNFNRYLPEFEQMLNTFQFGRLGKDPTYAQIDKTNWLTGESDTVILQYPPEWQLTLPTSKFDVNDFQLKEPMTNTLIQGSSGTLKSEYMQENPELYYNSYVNGATSEMIGAHNVESYPYGEITISELPAYSELYSMEVDYISGEKYGALISMIFYDDNTKYYNVISGSPVSEYEKIEPIMFEILKSITLKQ